MLDMLLIYDPLEILLHVADELIGQVSRIYVFTSPRRMGIFNYYTNDFTR